MPDINIRKLHRRDESFLEDVTCQTGFNWEDLEGEKLFIFECFYCNKFFQEILIRESWFENKF